MNLVKYDIRIKYLSEFELLFIIFVFLWAYQFLSGASFFQPPPSYGLGRLGIGISAFSNEVKGYNLCKP